MLTARSHSVEGSSHGHRKRGGSLSINTNTAQRHASAFATTTYCEDPMAATSAHSATLLQQVATSSGHSPAARFSTSSRHASVFASCSEENHDVFLLDDITTPRTAAGHNPTSSPLAKRHHLSQGSSVFDDEATLDDDFNTGESQPPSSIQDDDDDDDDDDEVMEDGQEDLEPLRRISVTKIQDKRNHYKLDNRCSNCSDCNSGQNISRPDAMIKENDCKGEAAGSPTVGKLHLHHHHHRLGSKPSCETCAACLLHQSTPPPLPNNPAVGVNNSKRHSSSATNATRRSIIKDGSKTVAPGARTSRAVTIAEPLNDSCCRIAVVVVCVQVALGIAINSVSLVLLYGFDILVDFGSAPLWAGIPVFSVMLSSLAAFACVAAALLTGLHAVRIRSYSQCIPSTTIASPFIAGAPFKRKTNPTAPDDDNSNIMMSSLTTTTTTRLPPQPPPLADEGLLSRIINKRFNFKRQVTNSETTTPPSQTKSGMEFTTRLPGEVMCVCQQLTSDGMMLLHYYYGHNDCKAIFYSLKDQLILLCAFNSLGSMFSLWLLFITVREEYIGEQPVPNSSRQRSSDRNSSSQGTTGGLLPLLKMPSNNGGSTGAPLPTVVATTPQQRPAGRADPEVAATGGHKGSDNNTLTSPSPSLSLASCK